MQENQIQEYGNITIKVKDIPKDSDMQAYKCPFLSCTAYYFNYQDLQSHKILAHGEMPKFFQKNQDSISSRHGGFSIKKVKRLGFYSTKHTLNTYATMLKILMNNKEEKTKIKN